MDAKQLSALRETFGFVVATNADPDLLGFLANCFMEDELEAYAESEDKKDHERFLAYIKKFVEHARETLRQNPPVTLTYIDRGLSVLLSNHQQLVLVEPKAAEAEKPKKPVIVGVPITNQSNKGGGLRGMVFQDTTVPITKGEKRK